MTRKQKLEEIRKNNSTVASKISEILRNHSSHIPVNVRVDLQESSTLLNKSIAELHELIAEEE